MLLKKNKINEEIQGMTPPIDIFKGKLLFIILVLFSCSCSETKKNNLLQSEREVYNIKICYIDCYNYNSEDYFNSFISTDSIYIFIEKDFKNDLVKIVSNSHTVFNKAVSTDSDGLSSYVIFKKTVKNQRLDISMNGGREAVIMIDSSINILNVNYGDSTLIVSVLNNAPFYE